MITPAPSDPPEIDALLWAGFSPTKLGLDIGANCGQSIPHMKNIAEFVHAYEPSEESFEVLYSSYRYDDRVAMYPDAVSEESGTIQLVAAPSKISTGQLVTHGTEGMEWSEDEMANGSLRTLKSVALDDLIEKLMYVGFIKIDVEGHELSVLRGAKALIAEKRPEMLIEIHSEELGKKIFDLLSPLYRIEIVRHPHYEFESPLWKTHFWMKCFRLTEGDSIHHD